MEPTESNIIQNPAQQKQEGIPQATTVKPKWINIQEALQNGSTYRDINELEKSTGFPVRPPTVEELMAKYPEYKNDPAKAEAAVKIADSQFRMYKDMDWDPFETLTNYAPQRGLGAAIGKSLGMKTSQLDVNDFAKRKPDYGVVDPELGFVETETGDQNASSYKFYLDQNNQMQPLAKADMAKGYLRKTLSKDGNFFYWKEAKEGELVPGNEIRAVFDRELTSNSAWTAAMRNAWYGFGPVFVKSIASGALTVGTLINKITDDDTPIQNTSGFKTFTNWTNWANSQMPQNVDETQGYFDNFTSFLSQTSNILGSLANMALFTVATSGVGMGIIKGAQALGAAESALTTSLLWNQRVATQAGLLLGDFMVMGGFQEQMINSGIDYDKAVRWSLPYGITSHLAFSVLPIMQSAGPKAMSKLGYGDLSGGMKKVVTKDIKKLIEEKFGANYLKVVSDKATDPVVKKTLYNSVYNALSKGKEYLTEMEGKKGFMAAVYKSGFGATVTTAQINAANFSHTKVSAWVNGTLGVWAEKYDNTFSKYQVVDNPENGLWTDVNGKVRGNARHPYKLVNSRNPKDFKLITEEEKDEFEKQGLLAKRILAGDKVLDDDFRVSDSYSMFFSTLIGLGIGSAIGSMLPKAKDRKISSMMIAMKGIKDPKYLEAFEKRGLEMVQNGEIQKNYMTRQGQIIKDGQLQNGAAGEVFGTLMTDVRRYMDIITRYKLDTDKFAYATGNLGELSLKAIAAADGLDKFQQALKEFNETGKYALNDVVAKDGMTKESLEKMVTDYEKAFTDIVNTKETDFVDSKNVPIKNSKSLAYTDLFLKAEAYEFIEKRHAEKLAMERIKVDEKDPTYKTALERETKVVLQEFKDNKDKMHSLKIWNAAYNLMIFEAMAHYDLERPGSSINALRSLQKNIIETHNKNINKPFEQRSLGKTKDGKFDIKPDDYLSSVNEILDVMLSETPQQNQLKIGFALDIKKLLKVFEYELEGTTQEALPNRGELNEKLTGIVGKLQDVLKRIEDYKKTISQEDAAEFQPLTDQLIPLSESFSNMLKFTPLKEVKYLNEIKRSFVINKDGLKEFKDVDMKSESFRIFLGIIPNSTETGREQIYLDEFLARYSATEDRVYEKPVEIRDNAKDFISRLEVMEHFISLNKEFFQDVIEKRPQSLEHTKLYSNDVRLNEAETIAVLSDIQRIKGELLKTIEKAEESKELREIDNTRIVVHDMSMKYWFINHLIEQSIAYGFEGDERLIKAFKTVTELLRKEGYLDGESIKNSMKKLWEDYYKNPEKREAIKKNILDVIDHEFEGAYDTLGGKLKKYEKDLIENYGANSYIMGKDLTEDIIIDFSSAAELKGAYSIDAMEAGLANTSGIPSMESMFAKSYILTQVHRINQYGETGKGENYSYLEIFQANKNWNQEKKGKLEKFFVFDSSAEQERLIHHISSFVLAPDTKYVLDTHKKDNAYKKRYIPNALVARGYLGVGKSTQIPMDVIGTMSYLSGKPQKVMIIVPNETISNNYRSMEAVLGTKLTDKKFSIVSKEEFFKNPPKDDYDMIFFEEGSYLSEEEIHATAKYMKAKVKANPKSNIIFLADDTQIPPENGLSYSSYIYQFGERTTPVIMTRRTGLKTISNFISDCRISRNNDEIIITQTGHQNLDTGRRGIYWHKDEAAVLLDFKTTVDRFIENGENPTEKNAILVVYNAETEKRLLESSILTAPVGEQNKYAGYIKHIYIDEADPNSKNKFVGGIASEKVFLMMDMFDKSDTRLYRVSDQKNSRAVAILMTVAGRAEGDFSYFTTINRELADKNVERPLIAFEKPGDYDLNDRFDSLIDHLTMITDDLETYKAKRQEVIDPPLPGDHFKNTSPADETAVETKVGDMVRKKVKTVAPKKEDIRVSQKIHESYLESIKDKAKTKEAEKNEEYNRNNTEIFRIALQTIIDPVKHTRSDFFKYLEENKAKYGIKNVTTFGNAWLNSIVYHPELEQILRSPLTILNSELNVEGLKGHPLVLQITGYTTVNGELKPIVNIYDMSISHVETKGTPPLTMLKLGTYAAMLQEQGIMVNEIKSFKWTKTDLDINAYDSKALTLEEKVSATKEGFKLLGKEEEPVFATDTDLYTIERAYDFADDVELSKQSEGDKFATWQGSQGNVMIHSLTRVLNKSKGTYDTYVYYKDYQGNAYPPMEKSLFMKEHKFKTFGKIQELHKSSAEVFDKEKLVYSSSAQDIIWTDNPTIPTMIPGNGKDIYDVSEKNGNPYMKVRQVINKKITIGTVVEKKYYAEVKTRGGKDGQKVLKNVIVNEIPDANKEVFFNMIKEDIKNKTGIDITFEQAKADGLFVISVDSVPEKDFGKDKTPERFSDDDVNIFIKLTDDAKANEMLDTMFEGSYKGDEFESQLVALNKYRLKALRYISQSTEPVKTNVGKIKEGTVIYLKSEKQAIPVSGNGKSLESIAKSHRFEIAFDEEIRTMTEEQSTGRRRVAGTLYRDNIENGSNFYADGMKLRSATELSEYIKKLKDEVTEFEQDATYVSKNKTLQKLLQSKKETDQERTEIVSQYMTVIRDLEAYKFIMTNQRFFKQHARLDALKTGTGSLNNLVFFNEKGEMLIRPKNSLTITEQSVNTLLNATLGGIKRVLETLEKNAEDYTASSIMEADFLRKSIYGKEGGIIKENIETLASDLYQKDFFIQQIRFDNKDNEANNTANSTNPTGRKGRKMLVGDIGEDRFLSNLTMQKEEARKQFVAIVGDEFGKKLEFIDHLKISQMPSDEQFYGQVYRAITTFAEKDGMVNPVVGKHEAMHIVTDYMLTPDAQKRILFDAKKRMVKEGWKESLLDIKDDDAYEFLSRLYENRHEHMKTDLISRFFDGIKYYANEFTRYKIFFGEDRISDMFRNADRGWYKDHRIVNWGTFDTMRRMDVENDWTKKDSIRFALDKFVNQINLDFIAINVVNPELINNHSYFNKAINVPISNMFSAINKLRTDFQYTKQEHDPRLNPKRKIYSLKIVNEAGDIETIRRGIADITPDEYQRMKMYRVKRTGEFSVKNADALREYEWYHLADDRVLYPILQSIMGNVDLQQLMKNEGKNIDAYSKMIFKVRGEDNNDTNPMGTQTEALKLLMSSMQRWRQDENGHWTNLDNDGHLLGYVDTATLHHMLIQAAINTKGVKKSKVGGVDKILNPSVTFSIDAWMKEINKMAKESTDGNQRDILHSFLIEMGDMNIYPDVNKNLLVDLGGDMYLEGIGRYAIIKDFYDPMGGEVARLYGINKNNKAYRDHVHYYTNIMNGFSQHFGSLFRRTNTIEEMFKDGTFNTVRQVNKLNTISNYNAKNVIELNLLSRLTGSLHTDISEKIRTGSKGQVWEVDAGMIYRVVDGKVTPAVMDDMTVMELMKFLGIDLTLSNLEKLRDTDADGNFLTTRKQLNNDLLHAMMALKVNDMLTEEIKIHKANKSSSALEFGDYDQITKGLYGKLLEYYYDSNNGYDIENARGLAGDNVPLPSPTDMFRFLDRVTEATKYNKLISTIGSSMDVMHNPTYPYNPSSHLHDLFGKPINGTTKLSLHVRDRILYKIENSTTQNFLNINTNLLAQGRFEFDDLDLHGGLKFINKGYKFEDLQASEKWKIFIDSTKKQMMFSKNVVGGFALLDTLSDTTSYPIIKFKYRGKNGSIENMFVVTKRAGTKELKSVMLNESVFIDYIKTIKGYYDELKAFSQGKWDAAGGKGLTEVPLKIMNETGTLIDNPLADRIRFNTVENRDYVITKNKAGEKVISLGNAITQGSSPFKNMKTVTKKSVYAAFDGQFKEMSQKLSDASIIFDNDTAELFTTWNITDNTPLATRKMVGDAISDSKTMGDAVQKYVTTLQEREAKRKAMVEARDKFVKAQGDPAAKNKEISDFDNATRIFKSGYESFIKHQSAEMMKAKYEQNGKYHPLIEAMFWNNYFMNESINQVTRGSDLMYKNFPDFVKRSKSVISPGDKFALGEKWNYLQKESRVLIVDDIWGKDPLFGKIVTDAEKGERKFFADDIELTNGYLPLNPLTHRAMFHDAGGVTGSLGAGTVKNVNSVYDQNQGHAWYIKSNSYPIHKTLLDNSKFYQDLTRMMMGNDVYNELMRLTNTEKMDWNDALDQILNNMLDPAHPFKFESQIDYIAFKSTVKGNSTRVNRLKNSLGGPASFSDIVIPMELNHEDNIVRISNESLRYQTNQKMNPVGGNTSIPMQELHILSFGWKEGKGNINMRIRNDVNRTITGNLDTIIGKISKLQTKSELVSYIRKIVEDYQVFNTRPDKTLQIIEDPNVSIDVIRKNAIQLLMTHTNAALRPRMPGAWMVQAPAIMRMFFDGIDDPGSGKFNETGLLVPHFAKDLNLTHDQEKVIGFGARELMPQGYDVVDKNGIARPITSREELASAVAQGTARYRAAEMVAPFYHMKTFGFNEYVSLAQIMMYNSKHGRKSLYDYYHTRRTAEQFAEQLKADLGDLSARKIFDSWDPAVARVLKRQYMEYLTMKKHSKGDLHSEEAINNEKLLKERNFFKDEKYKLEWEDDLNMSYDEFLEKNKLTVNDPANLYEFLSTYYKGINDSLDVVFVRIPTTNANMGTMARIIGFSNDAENIAYISPKKNTLDDSDYDGDALNTIYRPMRRFGVQPRDKDSEGQRLFFDAAKEYYDNVDNHESVLSLLDTKSIEDYVNKMPSEKKDIIGKFASNIASTISNDKIYNDGKRMVGHFINMSNIVSTLLSINPEYRSELFSNSRLLGSNIGIEESFSFITSMAQAGTINASLGGLLGKVNVNELTSPVILGMIYKGLTERDVEMNVRIQDKVFNMLTSNEMLLAVKNNLKAKTPQNEYQNRLWFNLENKVYTDPVTGEKYNLSQLALWGEQLRRVSDFTRFESDYGSSSFDLKRDIKNVERNVGMNFKDFLSSFEEIHKRGDEHTTLAEKRKYHADRIFQETKYLDENYLENVKSDRRMRMERGVRSTFDIAKVITYLDRHKTYLQILDSINDAVNKSFTVDSSLDGIIKHIGRSIKQNEIYQEKNYKAIEREVNRYNEGIFLETLDFNYEYNNVPDASMTQRQAMLMKLDGSLDLATQYGREMFFIMAPKYFAYIKENAKYKGNTFLKSMETVSSTRSNVKVLEIPNSLSLDPNTTHLLSIDFQRLEEKDKQFFRILNLLTYGFDDKNGSFNMFMDNVMEQRYSAFLEGKEFDMSSREKDIADEIIRKRGDLAQYSKAEKAEAKFYRSNNYTDKMTMLNEKVGNTYVRSINPMQDMVNPYFTNSINGKLNKAVPLTITEVVKLKENGEITLGGGRWNRIYDKESKTSQFFTRDGDTVILSNGWRATVKKIDDYSFKYIVDKKSILASKIVRTNQVMGKNAAEGMMYMVKKAFPNLTTILTSDADPANLNRDLVSYIYNGKFYINTDKIQSDTPLHEISHPLVLMLKHAGDHVYDMLRDEARQFIEGNSEDARMIKEEYSYLGKDDLYDEVISTIVGWKSADDVQLSLNKWKNNNWRAKDTIWGRVKGIIQTAWDRISQAFHGLLGLKNGVKLNTDFKSATIGDFTNELYQKVMNGEILSYVSSESLGLLMNGKYLASKIKLKTDLKVDNFRDIREVFFHGFTTPGQRELMEIESVKNVIKRTEGMKTPEWMSPKEITFTELESKESLAKIKSIIQDMKDRKKTFFADNVRFLNEHKGKPDQSIQTWTTINGDIVPVWGKDVMEKYRGAIEYSPNTKYYQYSTLKDHKELGYLYNEHMIEDGFDPVIAVEAQIGGKNKISVFDVVTDPLSKPDFAQPLHKRGLFRNVIDDKVAITNGLSLSTAEVDLHRLYMTLLLNEFNNKEKVILNSYGIISMPSGEMNWHSLNMSYLKGELLNMANAHDGTGQRPVLNAFKGGNLTHVLDRKFIKPFERDFLAELMEFSREDPDAKYMMPVYEKVVDNSTLIHLANMRIKRIQKAITEESVMKKVYSTHNEVEMNLLVGLIKQLSSIPSQDALINTERPITNATAMTPSAYIPNDAYQTARQLFLNASNRVVAEFNDVMKDFRKEGGIFDKFRSKASLIVRERIANVSDPTFGHMFVKIKDINDQWIETGLIWNSDLMKDPLFKPYADELIRTKKLDKEDIEMGDKIVDLITENLAYQHQWHENLQKLTYYGQRDYMTLDQARENLFKGRSGYRKGMIPLMPRSTGEALAKGKVAEAFKKRFVEAFDVYSDFSEQSRVNIPKEEDLNQLRDMFYFQFGVGSTDNGILGSYSRTESLLGLKVMEGRNNGMGYALTEDGKSINSSISKNLEMVLNYYIMTARRNVIYESQVLPAVNAIKILRFADSHFRNEDAIPEIKQIQEFENMFVRGKRRKVTGESWIPGVEWDQLLQGAYVISAPAALLFNINVPIVSFIGNTMFSAVEGITNSIAKRGGFEKGMFGASELMKGTGHVITPLGYKKAMQLAYDMQIFKNTEFDLINLQANSRTKKSLLTRFYTNWTDWAVNGFTRALSIAAQMEKDGTWDAHIYNEKTGTITYDPRLDRRLGWDGKRFSEKGQAYLDWLKEQQKIDGMPNVGYSSKEARSIKTLGDNYLIGTYDAATKNSIANHTIGRMFQMFKTFMISRIENAITHRKTINDAGHIEMMKDADGHYYAQWEQLMVEGYVRTIFNYMRDSVYNKRVKLWKELDNIEKYNIVHSAVNLTMFTSMFAMYKMFVSTKEEEKAIPNWRIVRNFEYGARSLLVLPMMYDFATKPFATIDILTGFWSKPFGQAGINIPFSKQYSTIIEPIRETP